VRDELLGLMNGRRGHFVFESGHHGDLWLDLDGLFSRPAALTPAVDALAERLTAWRPEVVCGPLTGGAFLAHAVAARLDLGFCWSERSGPGSGELYGVRYRIPGTPDPSGRRVAVVDDVINAGSAVRATLAALEDAGAVPVAVAALLALGTPAAELAAARGLGLETLGDVPNSLWSPAACPLCAAGSPPSIP
jgi:orotate phosphoribosyltransferase